MTKKSIQSEHSPDSIEVKYLHNFVTDVLIAVELSAMVNTSCARQNYIDRMHFRVIRYFHIGAKIILKLHIILFEQQLLICIYLLQQH